MCGENSDQIQTALAIIIIVVLLISFEIHRDTLRRRSGVDSFASEKEKLDRAKEVVDKAAPAFKSNPNLSFDQFKDKVKDGDAVEYKDLRASGGNANPSTLAAGW